MPEKQERKKRGWKNKKNTYCKDYFKLEPQTTAQPGDGARCSVGDDVRGARRGFSSTVVEYTGFDPLISQSNRFHFSAKMAHFSENAIRSRWALENLTALHRSANRCMRDQL